MNTQATTPLDQRLASILAHVQALQHLNMTVEGERAQALDELPRLLGAIARYRHGLEHAPAFRPAA